ncbi:MAG TPA: tRNA (N(6)-L-threonylcarbamoyladenosine(37)-C(2))-methylthiotransferase MtaB [Bacteroidales bacterium]|nr:tRNA (N(6)-L-threonylcarbamoyladenosine(37)-C(2))-methylthiotransferase MtaB [Bacteroidales bacterium]
MSEKSHRIAFQTFGCKLNFAETSTIARQFREDGYEVVEHRDLADIYVINSCVVTSNAEKKCKAAIRQAKRRNPDARVAVVGCFSQMKDAELAAMEEVDLVIGNEEKFMLKSYLREGALPGACHSHVGDINRSDFFAPSWSSGDRTRSFLKVQDGCDYFCTFCTIPFARGRSRSATIAETIASAREIAGTGMKEIILTGVNIGDFGKPHGESFFSLIQELDKVEGIERIRISSIEPDLLNEDIIQFIATSEKFLPHFHIPLQSGSDKVLQAMKRKYPREIFAKRVKEIKKHMPAACVAADVIIGFPGETDEDFRETYQFLENLDIAYMHVFTYSERPGTRAAGMENKVSSKTKRERSKLLHDLSDRKKDKFYNSNVGNEVSVLFESDNNGGYMHGFSENYLKVKTIFREDLINSIVKVMLGKPEADGCFNYRREDRQ